MKQEEIAISSQRTRKEGAWSEEERENQFTLLLHSLTMGLTLGVTPVISLMIFLVHPSSATICSLVSVVRGL